MSTLTETKPAAKQLTIRDRLNSPAQIAEFARALPKHCSPDRMARVALTALTRTPKLQDCEPASFFRCMLELSQWGLEPDGRRAHLIPFENRKRGVIECQLIVDYKGFVELAYRSGFVKAIHADVVREGDLFRYNLGEVVEHVPHFLRRDANKPKEEGEVFAAYCRVQLEGGATKTEVLSKREVDGIRARSRAGNNGPWVTDYCEMAKKTAFRRCSKWLPLSAEIMDALEGDDDKIDEAIATQRQPLQTISELSALLNAPEEEETTVNEPEQPFSVRDIIANINGFTGTKSELAAFVSAYARDLSEADFATVNDAANEKYEGLKK
mgnify:CR=1 FL=1